MEGPSLHHLAEKLRFFRNQRINFVDGTADQPLGILKKRTIDSVRAVKKRLFFDAGDAHAVIHFLMYGSYRVNETREGMDPRLVLDCSDDLFVTYNSAVKVLKDGADDLQYYNRPEEDVLSDQFDRDQVLRHLQSFEGPLVDVLLDQDVFGGVGNIIKNEVLFRTNHLPHLTSSSLSDRESHELIEETIAFAKHWLETKQSDEPLGLKVYQKNTCAHCGDEIKKDNLGQHDRVTYWCPTCQCQ